MITTLANDTSTASDNRTGEYAGPFITDASSPEDDRELPTALAAPAGAL
ncbi:MAG TPA: hypothetical protein VFO93_04320 [Hymenobacter sp.]|nr:hypothetical protein [Hymenobacter sp.]HET9502741.1 hypothetical protein [Hymenobacter sp.]